MGPSWTEGWGCRLAGTDHPASDPAASLTDLQLERVLGMNRPVETVPMVVGVLVSVELHEMSNNNHSVYKCNIHRNLVLDVTDVKVPPKCIHQQVDRSQEVV